MPSNDATRIPATGVVHSAKEWERRKPKIRELYMDQQLTLRKTQKLMRRDHKFSATEKQYKSRFIKWGFRKYSPRKSTERAFVASGNEVENLSIQDRPDKHGGVTDYRAEINAMINHPSFASLSWVPFSVINRIDWIGTTQDQEHNVCMEKISARATHSQTPQPWTGPPQHKPIFWDPLNENHPVDPWNLWNP